MLALIFESPVATFSGTLLKVRTIGRAQTLHLFLCAYAGTLCCDSLDVGKTSEIWTKKVPRVYVES